MKNPFFITRNFIIITLFCLSTFFKNEALAQVVLYSENFGTTTASPAGWTTSGDWQVSSANVSTGFTGASGGSNLIYTNSPASPQVLIYNNNLSTVGYQNITLLWGARLARSSATNTIAITLSWSADGTTWNNVSFTNISLYDGTWNLVNSGARIALPAAAAGIPNLRLRLSAVPSAGNNNTTYRIDDFSVQACTTAAISGTTTATCVGGSTGTITASATGGVAPYTYSLGAGAYQASTLFSGLAAGTYILNTKTNTGCISSVNVTVTPYPNSTDNQAAVTNNSWTGHIYSGTTLANYIGHFTETENFNELFGGAANCFSVVSNSISRSIYSDSLLVRFLMNSTKKGLYTVDLGSDEGSRLSVDGILVSNNYTNHIYSAKPSALINLSGSSSLLYEYYEVSGNNQVVFQNLTQVLANTLSANITQTICGGSSNTVISGDTYGTLPAGITLAGTGYQWTYSTTPSGTRVNIVGATGASFIPLATTTPFNTPGTYYVYRNALLSSINNILPNPFATSNESNAATITVIGSAISQIPSANLIANYKFEGDATDATGNNNGTLQNAPTTNSDRFNIAGKAYSFNGSNQFVTTANSYNNPTDFSISIWFKTNSVAGGKLIGFGDAQISTSGSFDRHLYMNDAGKIYFGVYPSAVVTVSSALSYNDNNWHMATATLSSSTGMALYVDGAVVGTNPATTTAQNFTGFWKIGYDNTGGWTSQPTSFYFNGSLDDALIYHRVLTGVEISTLYKSPDGAGNNGPVCIGSSVSLSAPAIGSAVYTWTGPNSFTSALQNPTLTYNAANTGTYKLQVTAAGCTSTAYTNVVSTTVAGQWSGNVNTDWANTGNWCSGVLPGANDNVTITTGPANMPSVISTGTCKSLTINAGATVTVTAAGTLNIAGTLTNNGTYIDNGTTNFNGTTGQQTFAGVNTFNNLTINNSNGLLLSVITAVKNNLTITAGTLNASTYNILVAGNWINNSSLTAFTAGLRLVTFNGTAAQSIGGSFATTFNDISILNTGNIVSLNVNTNISNSLLVSTGTLNLGAYTANRLTAGGSLTVSNNAVLKIGGINSFPVNYSTSNLAIAGTVEYSGTDQAVANQTYGNLTLSSASGAVTKTLSATAFNIAGNLTSTIGSGTSVTFTAGSDIAVGGNVAVGASTIFNGSSYLHTINGNWVNDGTFNGNSGTITFAGAGKGVSGTGIQNFNNLTVASSLITFSNNSISLSGNLATTGSGSFSQAAGGTLTMTGANTAINGNGISLHNLTVTGTVSTATFLNLSGNLSVSGRFSSTAAPVNMVGIAKTISGAGTKSFTSLLIPGTITTNANFSILSALTVTGSLTATAGIVTFTGAAVLSGTANLFNATINGTSLQLFSNSILGIANILTVSAGNLDVTTTVPNTVNFNGNIAQNINAINYDNLILSNGNNKTAIDALTVYNSLTIAAGTNFSPGAFTHSIYVDWNNLGTFTAGTSTIQFLGNQNTAINGATSFNELTLNKASSVSVLTLQSNVSLPIVNMIMGTMHTGSNTITITTTRTGNGKILGNIQRTHAFTTGVAYAFETPNNSILFSSVSGVTTITVSIVESTISDFPFGASIDEQYTISVPAGTYNATLRLSYESYELNGNNEASMQLWNYNGSAWTAMGKTANDITNDWVEQSGLTNITNRWTLSDNSNVVQWTGNVSSDWNTAGNWNVLQGSASAPPTAMDIANIGTGAFVNQPTISTAVSVKNINFGSVQAVTLTMGSGGSLTSGLIHGNWSSNAAHSINVNNQTVNINGSLVLSDGVAGHAINLTIGTGTVNITGSLNQSGGANIIFSAAGNLNLGGDYNYTNGTFTAGSGTVTYNGASNQLAAAVNYNHLIINKSTGAAALNSITNIAGNFTIIAGEIDNNSTTSIIGNVLIGAGATLRNHQTLHVGGNWTNNGNYTATGASIFFDGTGTQNITATTFNNFNINKPVGSVAVLLGNIGITGNFTVTSGTLNTGIFDLSRQTLGGTFTIADLGTVLVSGNNVPANFSTFSVGASSTVIFDGTSPQSLPIPGTFGNLIFRNGGIKTVGAPILVLGNLTIEPGSILDAGAETISLNGNWINNGTFTPSTSTVLLNGNVKTLFGITSFNNLTVYGNYTILNNMAFNGLLNITAAAAFYAGAAITVTMNGDLINSGILNTQGTTTFTGNILQTLSLINAVQTVAVTVNFNGSVTPVLNSTSAPLYGFLNINNTAGINPSVDWTVLYTLTVGAGASFNGGNGIHNIMGNVINNGTITSSGTMNFIPATAANINLGTNYFSTSRTVFGGAGAITLAGTPAALFRVLISNTNAAGVAPSSNWNISNNFFINAGSKFNAGNYTISVGGNISNSGTLNSGSSTFIMTGAVNQDIYTISPFNNLSLNKTGGAVTLTSNTTVNGAINFIAGQIQTGAFIIIQPAAGTITGAAQNTGWVNGKIQKYLPAGNTIKNFEIGDTTIYSPVSLAFNGISTGGDITANVVTGDHSNLIASPINGFKSVNRYWVLKNTGIVFTDYAATFNFAASDIDASASTAAFSVVNHNGSSWSVPVTTLPNPLNITATGLTLFDHYVVGEICNKVTKISYATAIYCTDAGTASVAQTGNSGGIYSAGAGLSINASTGTIDLSTSTPGTYIVNYNLSGTSECASYLTSATIKVGAAGKWTGALSNVWNNISNWGCAIPVAASDVIIPGGLSIYPIITGTNNAHNLTIQSGGFLTVAGGTLQIAGSMSNAGTFDVSSGTIELNGTVAQTIPAGFFTNNIVKNLIISNDVNLAGTSIVSGTLSVAAGKTFNTNNNLVIKSDAGGTARIAELPVDGAGTATAFITGNVSIERYIPARRSWRLLSAPVSSVGAPTINAAWQEGVTTASANADPNPGYGTHITGGTEANGFDLIAGNSGSIKYYNNATGAMLVPASTNIPITNYAGYFLFVRGNRAASFTSGIPNNTTLRMKGLLATGKQTVALTPGGYSLLGNPYASAINFATLTRTNISNRIYVWDPKLGGNNGVGGYITGSWNVALSTYDFTSAISPVSQYIPSGEAFFVVSPDAANPASISIKESDKTTGGSDQIFGFTGSANSSVRVDLFGFNTDSSRVLADGLLATYFNNNSNAVDEYDAGKIYNAGENISLSRAGKNLSIERRKMIADTDTLFINMMRMKQQTYQLEITLQDMGADSGMIAILKDNLAGSLLNDKPLNLSGVNTLSFAVTSNAATFAANRFSIIFRPAFIVPVTIQSISARQQQKDIVVKWQVENQVNIINYDVEISANGSSFTKAATIPANTLSSSAYTWADVNASAGLHFYRVIANDLGGPKYYSSIVKINMGAGTETSSLNILANNISGRNLSLQLKGIVKDLYDVQILNAAGQMMYQQTISHAGGTVTYTVSLPGNIPAGKYQVLLLGSIEKFTSSFVKF